MSRWMAPVRSEVAAAGRTDRQPRVPDNACPFIAYPLRLFQGERLAIFRPPITEAPVS